VLEPGAGDHLRADEAGPVTATLSAERLNADAGHRRQHEACWNQDVPDPPGLAEIHLHRAGNRTRRDC